MRGQTALDGRGTRDAFLASLRSAGRYKYGRYNGLPLRYAGGKSLAVGHVVENLPHRLARVISPFIGGGSVEIACARELGVPVQGYDVFDVLTNYWEVQLSAPKALADRIRQWEPTQQRYRQVKQRLKEHWIGTRPIPDALELAAHYWFNHNLAYGPGFLGWMSKIYEDEVRYERLVAKVERFSCPTLSVRQGGFEETIPAHSGDFLYCDPPYYLDGDSKMFRGIYPQRNHHVKASHELLIVKEARDEPTSCRPARVGGNPVGAIAPFRLSRWRESPPQSGALSTRPLLMDLNIRIKPSSPQERDGQSGAQQAGRTHPRHPSSMSEAVGRGCGAPPPRPLRDRRAER